MESILVIDDEPAIVAVVRDRLEREGFAVQAAASGEEALARIPLNPPRLVVLDVMLPGMDGFEVLRQLQGRPHPIPVIMLTARDEDIDRIVGLEMGADDYLVKPFHPRELSARVRAVLRRCAAGRVEAAGHSPSDAAPGERQRRLRFDDGRRRVFLDDQAVDLRPREYDLLRFLARNAGQVFTRDSLLDHVWGRDAFIGARTVDVHVRRLRRKLGLIAPAEDVILTEWGVGYRLADGF